MKNKFALLEGALVLTPFAVLGALWNKLPARIPMHWNIRAEVDRWSSNRLELLILPLFTVAVVALCHVVSWLDPKLRRNLENTDRMKRVLQIFGVAFAGLFNVVFAVQLSVALGYQIPGGQIIMACILLLLAILGNYLPNLRPNYFIGIRTPWTLENRETWRATHRVGGKLMFFGALLLLVLEFLLEPSVFAFLFLSSILLLVVWAFLYSYRHFRKYVITRKPV